MNYKNKLKLTFAGLLLAGISLCIAGVWVPALLVPGAVFLGGAFGMFQSVFNENTVDGVVNHDHNEDAIEMVRADHSAEANKNVIEQNIGVFFMYQPRSSSPDYIYEDVPDRTSAPTPSRLTLM